MILTIFNNFWQLWIFFDIFGNLRLFDNIWQLLTISIFLTTSDNFDNFSSTFSHLWFSVEHWQLIPILPLTCSLQPLGWPCCNIFLLWSLCPADNNEMKNRMTNLELTLPQVSDIWLHELHWPTSNATKIH